MVDKNLFPYDLAVVAIMKDEEPYVQEWLDYHLLAGVDHFYIYDNDSTPEFKEILQPYIDEGIVTYTFYPGKFRQMEAYNDAIQRYRFFCRYMTFIDGDEFIFPKSKPTIAEVVDEVFNTDSFIAGMSVSTINYGSNGEEKADYEVGVLERFTRRAKNISESIKSIVNPRAVNYFWTAHFPEYFQGCNFVIANSLNIVVNHYHTKSCEEYFKKTGRGNVTFDKVVYNNSMFKNMDSNEVFDDGILNYVDARLDELTAIIGDDGLDAFIESKKFNHENLLTALSANLSPVNSKAVQPKFFEGKLETFLTCWKLSLYIQKFFPEGGNFFENLSLIGISNSLTKISQIDLELIVSELPDILADSHFSTKAVCDDCITVIALHKEYLKKYIAKSEKLKLWKNFVQWDYISRMIAARG